MSGRLVVVGQGYVGLPLAIRAVDAGFTVVGVEAGTERAEALAAGESYVGDIPSEVLQRALATGRYTATSNFAAAADFDVAVIAVPTPLKEGSTPDLSMIAKATEDLAPHVKAGATVILESTTYPGTTEELVAPLLESGSGLRAGPDFHLGYSPERIDPGNQTWTLVNTPKVVSGIDAASAVAVKGFYDAIIDTTIPVSSCRVAELTKLLENTFRHVNIALMNELAIFSHALGIDLWEAIDAASTKPFGYMRFTPGPGVGGHCLPVDPAYLAWEVKRTLGHSFRFVELANDVNDHMPDYVVRRIAALLNKARKPVNGSRILLLGLAYKKNTADVRESPALRVAQLLLEQSAAVCAFDPYVNSMSAPAGVEMISLSDDELSRSDLAVLLTDHDEIIERLSGISNLRILDTRNRLTPGEGVHRL